MRGPDTLHCTHRHSNLENLDGAWDTGLHVGQLAAPASVLALSNARGLSPIGRHFS